MRACALNTTCMGSSSDLTSCGGAVYSAMIMTYVCEYPHAKVCLNRVMGFLDYLFPSVLT